MRRDAEMNELDDPEIKRATEQLFARIKSHMGQAMSPGKRKDIMRTIKEHRADCRLRGIRFPEMTCIFLPQQGFIDVVRADLEHKDLQTVIVNLTVKCPEVSAEELARGVCEAFPWYARNTLRFKERRTSPPVNGGGASNEEQV